MADITVAAGDKGTAPFQLTANTAQGVAFADNVGAIQVISDGTAHVFGKVGSGNAVVPSGASAGPGTYTVPSFAPILDVNLGGNTEVSSFDEDSPDRVSLISTGTPWVVVQRA